MAESEQIISLTSSDEEDNPEPPPKKLRTTPIIVPQVTLTLVKNTKKKEKTIETVTLDSDDETTESQDASLGPQANMTNQKITTINSGNLELITLTDDEEDIQVQTREVNAMIQSILGTGITKSVTITKKSNSKKVANKVETVSLTDSDSDMEITTEDLIEETSERLQGKIVENAHEKSDELQTISGEKPTEETQQKSNEMIQEKSLEEIEDKPEKSTEDIKEMLNQENDDGKQKETTEIQENSVGPHKINEVVDDPDAVIDKEVAKEIDRINDNEKGTDNEHEKNDVNPTNDDSENMVIGEDVEKTSTVQVTEKDKLCENNVDIINENKDIITIDEDNTEKDVEKNVNNANETDKFSVIDDHVAEETSTVPELVEKDPEIFIEDSTTNKLYEENVNNGNKNIETLAIDEEVAAGEGTSTSNQPAGKCNEEIAENGPNDESMAINDNTNEVLKKNINDTNENVEIMVIDDEVVEETSTANDTRENSEAEITEISVNKVCGKIVNNTNESIEIMVIDDDIHKDTSTETATDEVFEKKKITNENTEVTISNETEEVAETKIPEKECIDEVCEKNASVNEINTNTTRAKDSSRDSDFVNYNSPKNAYISLEKIECGDTSITENNFDSIVIEDSDDDTEKENHCEEVDIEPFSVKAEKVCAVDIPGPSDPSKDEAVFQKFLKIVEQKIVGSSFEGILPKKVPIIEKYFKRCDSYINEKVFDKLLRDSIESVSRAPNSSAANTAVLAFHRIFEHLKSRVAESTIEIEEEHLPKVKKLEKTMKLLRKRIKQLEETEVNFDDDEDSAYIMLDRYQARLNKVYAKYCEYIRRNPYSGRPIYDKISFVHSKYNEINQAISRKYRNSINFPSYYELEKYITKVAKKEKLDLSEQEIKHESKKCFKHLGSILQKKRRQELYDSHLDFIEFTEDPATKDISLENVLRKNYSEGKDKIEKIYEKYVNKQEQGEDHVSSDDAGTSEGSDSEENNKNSSKNGKTVKKKGVKKSVKNSIEKSKKENEGNKKQLSTLSETETNSDKEKAIDEHSDRIDNENIVNGHTEKVMIENVEKT